MTTGAPATARRLWGRAAPAASPRRPSRSRLLAAVVASAVLLALLAYSGLRHPSPAVLRHPSPPTGAGAAAATRMFLGRFVSPDGRVVRRDQGGDTVSEGQAYAMLMTAALGDRREFHLVWSWTRTHLERGDGLLAWHWAGGSVTGEQPAADADVGAAAALVIASHRFGDPSLMAEGRTLAAAVMSHEIIQTDGGPTLAAGPWAVTAPQFVNPSYLAPVELDALSSLGGRWAQVAATASGELLALTRGGRLPPDWAVIVAGRMIPAPAPAAGGNPMYGFDAVRIPIWMALSCQAPLRRAAAGLQPSLDGGRMELTLTGQPAPGLSSPVGLLGEAATAWAAGRTVAAWRVLDSVLNTERAHPTYYADALAALTALGFEHRLGSC